MPLINIYAAIYICNLFVIWYLFYSMKTVKILWILRVSVIEMKSREVNEIFYEILQF